eukprot:242400-Hanusia_phi.AAC.1
MRRRPRSLVRSPSSCRFRRGREQPDRSSCEEERAQGVGVGGGGVAGLQGGRRAGRERGRRRGQGGGGEEGLAGGGAAGGEGCGRQSWVRIFITWLETKRAGTLKRSNKISAILSLSCPHR